MSKAALWATRWASPMKSRKPSATSAKRGLSRRNSVGQAVHRDRALRHVALGIDVDVEGAAGRQVVHQLDAADLDQPVAAQRVEPGRLGVEDDLAHHAVPRPVSCPPAHLARRTRSDAVRPAVAARPRSRGRCRPRNAPAAASRHPASAGPGWRRTSPPSCPAGPAPARAAQLRGAVTTTTASTRASPPVSNSSGMSSTTMRRAGRARRARNALGVGAHQRDGRCASRRRSAAAIAEHAGGQRRAVDAGRRGGAGKARLDRRHGGRAIERVHRGVGVVHRHARPRRTCAAVADLPMPIEPVRPSTIIAALRGVTLAALDVGLDQRAQLGASPPASPRTSARSPAPPGAAACRGRRRRRGRAPRAAARSGGLQRHIDDVGDRGVRPAAGRGRWRARGWPAMPSEVVLTRRSAPASSAGRLVPAGGPDPGPEARRRAARRARACG